MHYIRFCRYHYIYTAEIQAFSGAGGFVRLSLLSSLQIVHSHDSLKLASVVFAVEVRLLYSRLEFHVISFIRNHVHNLVESCHKAT
jgi:hypothetical protein